MNSTKAKLMLLWLILIAFVACDSDNNDVNEPNALPNADNFVNLTAQEYASIAFDNPKELSETEVISIAENFVKSKETIEAEKLGTKASISNLSFKVTSKYYCGKDNSNGILTKSLNKNEVNVLIYELSVVNSNETGLIVVSGDERAQKVIAYIPKIDEKANTFSSGVEYLKELAKINLIDGIEEFIQLRDSLRIPTLYKIASKLGIDSKSIKFDEIKNYLSVNDEPISKFKPIQTPPSQVLSYVLPMCKVQWDQQTPYNNNLPEGIVEKYFPGYFEEGHYPSGCGVIALAHIMTIIQPSITVTGTTMNWAYLIQNPTIVEPDYFNSGDPADKREMVAKLIRDIYDKTGSFPEKNSDGYVTGVATYDSSCETYIKLYANCSSRQKWNSDIVRNSILAMRPVLATGQGLKPDNSISKHAFVIDGYLLCKLYYGAMSASTNTGTKELVKLYDLYFHANFGWNGSGDGYYLINKDTSVDFETDNATYRTGDLNVIASVVKK